MPTGTRCSSARSPGCGGGGDELVVSMVMCLLPRYGRVLSVYPTSLRGENPLVNRYITKISAQTNIIGLIAP